MSHQLHPTDSAADWKLAAPAEYAKALFAADLRPAGTSTSATGDVTRGCFGGAHGSACAVLGGSIFACGVTASLVDRAAAEAAAAAAAGSVTGAECHPLLAAGIVFNADLPPICSRMFRPGPPVDLAQALTVQVSDALAQSGCLDYDRLNVGRRHRLQLHIDAVCLSADGSLPDACLLAVSAALCDLRLPRLVQASADAAVDGVAADDRRREPLALLRDGSCVLCSSFALPASASVVDADNEARLLPTPNQLEESLPGIGIVRVFTAGSQEVRIVSLQKMGAVAATPGLLARCCRLAKARHAAAMAGPLLSADWD